MSREAYQALVVWLVVVVLLGGLATALWAVPSPPDMDEETLCRKHNPPPSQTILLVDKTDPLTPPQRDRLAQLIRDELARIPRHGELLVFVIDQHGSFLTPRFAACSPGTQDQANVWYENGRDLEARFEKHFAAPLAALLADLQRGTVSPTSPILESLEAVAHRFESHVPELRLILFSDMLQNSADFSHYRYSLRLETWTRQPPVLYGVQVVLYYLERDNGRRIQRQPEHRAFWDAYWQHTGAYSVSWFDERGMRLPVP